MKIKDFIDKLQSINLLDSEIVDIIKSKDSNSFKIRVDIDLTEDIEKEKLLTEISDNLKDMSTGYMLLQDKHKTAYRPILMNGKWQMFYLSGKIKDFDEYEWKVFQDARRGAQRQ